MGEASFWKTLRICSFPRKSWGLQKSEKRDELVKEISDFTHTCTECWTFHKVWGTQLKVRLLQQEREGQWNQADLWNNMVWGISKPLFLSLIQCVLLSHIQLFAAPRTVARQAPLSMGFSRKEYWSGLPCPSPEDLRDPGIKPRCPTLRADS